MIIVINNQRMYEKSYQQSKSSNCLFYHSAQPIVSSSSMVINLPCPKITCTTQSNCATKTYLKKHTKYQTTE